MKTTAATLFLWFNVRQQGNGYINVSYTDSRLKTANDKQCTLATLLPRRICKYHKVTKQTLIRNTTFLSEKDGQLAHQRHRPLGVHQF
jgi:hypothetical protein